MLIDIMKYTWTYLRWTDEYPQHIYAVAHDSPLTTIPWRGLWRRAYIHDKPLISHESLHWLQKGDMTGALDMGRTTLLCKAIVHRRIVRRLESSGINS